MALGTYERLFKIIPSLPEEEWTVTNGLHTHLKVKRKMINLLLLAGFTKHEPR
jgi:hypothetical protein